MSNQLIHFTKGRTDEEAFLNLQSIVDDKRIVGHSRKIKARCSCVCLTEAPLQAMVDGFTNLSGKTEYRLFGIMFDKGWIYDHGGRPVIYEPAEDYSVLPASHKWRHVRYEPTGANSIDFTWEREWRTPCSELKFEPSNAAVVLPADVWRDGLMDEFDREQDFLVWYYSMIMDMGIAEQYREDFPWRVVVLGK